MPTKKDNSLAASIAGLTGLGLAGAAGVSGYSTPSNLANILRWRAITEEEALGESVRNIPRLFRAAEVLWGFPGISLSESHEDIIKKLEELKRSPAHLHSSWQTHDILRIKEPAYARRISKRVKRLLEAGKVDEAKRLLEEGFEEFVKIYKRVHTSEKVSKLDKLKSFQDKLNFLEERGKWLPIKKETFRKFPDLGGLKRENIAALRVRKILNPLIEEYKSSLSHLKRLENLESKIPSTLTTLSRKRLLPLGLYGAPALYAIKEKDIPALGMLAGSAGLGFISGSLLKSALQSNLMRRLETEAGTNVAKSFMKGATRRAGMGAALSGILSAGLAGGAAYRLIKPKVKKKASMKKVSDDNKAVAATPLLTAAGSVGLGSYLTRAALPPFERVIEAYYKEEKKRLPEIKKLLAELKERTSKDFSKWKHILPFASPEEMKELIKEFEQPSSLHKVQRLYPMMGLVQKAAIGKGVEQMEDIVAKSDRLRRLIDPTTLPEEARFGYHLVEGYGPETAKKMLKRAKLLKRLSYAAPLAIAAVPAYRAAKKDPWATSALAGAGLTGLLYGVSIRNPTVKRFGWMVPAALSAYGGYRLLSRRK